MTASAIPTSPPASAARAVPTGADAGDKPEQLDRIRRLKAAQALTAAQDIKAEALAAVAALLLLTGNVRLDSTIRSAGAAQLTIAAAAAIVVALLALLAVLIPRGGSPAGFLLGTPLDELCKVTRIAVIKHRYLMGACWALVVSVVLGLLALIVAGGPW